MTPLEDRITPVINFSVVPGGTLEINPIQSIFPAGDYAYMAVQLTTVPGTSHGTFSRIFGLTEMPWGTSDSGVSFGPATTAPFNQNRVSAGSIFRYVNTSGAVGAQETIPVQFRNSTGVSKYDDTIVITVANLGTPPTIIAEPNSIQSIGVGQTVTLSVQATGTAPLSYQWYQGDAPSTGWPIAGATGSTYTPPPFNTPTNTSTGPNKFWVRVSNPAGSVNSLTAAVYVGLAPTANAGGPYTVGEFQTVPLSGLNSSDDQDKASQLTYTWDLNNDGLFGHSFDELGATPLFLAAAFADGPGAFQIALKVADTQGLHSSVAYGTVNVANAPPQATFAGTVDTVGFSNIIDSNADVAAGFTYSYDFDYDGTYDVIESSAASVAVPAAFQSRYLAGNPVRGRIVDKDGGAAVYAATINGRAIVVNTLADENNSTATYQIQGGTSLREAVALAQQNTDADNIAFDPVLFGGPVNLSLLSELLVSTPVAITAPLDRSGVALVGTGAAGNIRAFNVTASGSLTLENLTIRDFAVRGERGQNGSDTGSGSAGPGGGGGGGAGTGGAIYSEGTVVIRGSTLMGNSATGGNGGNSAGPYIGGTYINWDFGGRGGGPNFAYGGVGYLGVAGTHGGNGGFASGAGGGASAGQDNPPTPAIEGNPSGNGGVGGLGGGGGGGGSGLNTGSGGFGSVSILGGGSGANGIGTSGGGGGGGAGLGGAILNNGGSLIVENTTFTANGVLGGTGGTALAGTSPAGSGLGLGAAIFSRNGSVTLRNVTLSGNSASQGRGLFVASDGTGKTATATIFNSILGQADAVVTDFATAAVNGGANPVTTGSHNLIRNAAGFGGIASNADPLLGPLSNNDGPTLTFAPQGNSPSFNGGTNAQAAGNRDQRGRTRVLNAVDIGAYESPVITVDNLGDASDGNLSAGQVTLREAMQLATDSLDANTIVFGLSGTITLGSTLPNVRDTVNIVGPGTGALTISGNNQVRVLFVEGSGYLSLRDLTIANGYSDNGSGIFSVGGLSLYNSAFTGNRTTFNGGGIYQHGSIMFVNGSTFSNNSAANAGGAFFLGGNASAYVSNSSLNGNTAFGEGGAIENYAATLDISGTQFANNQQTELNRAGGAAIHSNNGLTISTSTFANNTAAAGGGALTVNGTTELLDSTFSGNTAGSYGGGVWSFGTLTIRNSTLNNNRAFMGGALQSWGDGNSKLTTVQNSTLAANTATHAGAADTGSVTTSFIHVTIADNVTTSGGAVLSQYTFPATLTNTIVARNTGASLGTVNGGTITGSNNIIGMGGAAGIVHGVNGNMVNVSDAALSLGILASNGAANKTIALLPFSPAINAGTNAGLSTDQRGMSRVDTPDIGAYETPYYTPTNITLSNATVSEAATVGTEVGILNTIDQDSTSFTYTLVSGTGDTHNSLFTLSGSQLKTAADLSGVVSTTLSIRIFSIDSSGLSTEKNFAITVQPLTATVSTTVVNNGEAQGSRLTRIDVTLSGPFNLARLQVPGAITLTRMAGGVPVTVEASNGLQVSPAAGFANGFTITFANIANSGVEYRSLADGYWRLSIPLLDYASTPGDTNFRRFFGDINGDGTVDGGTDFTGFGFRTAVNDPFDFNGDGTVDGGTDFAEFGNRFGRTI